jgi:hypothetical protein
VAYRSLICSIGCRLRIRQPQCPLLFGRLNSLFFAENSLLLLDTLPVPLQREFLALIYLTKVDDRLAADVVEITPGMIEVGANRLWELEQAGVASTYVAEEVYVAMRRVWHASARAATIAKKPQMRDLRAAPDLIGPLVMSFNRAFR